MPPYRFLSPGGVPAPLVDAVFGHGTLKQTVRAVLDTGADQTQVPETIARTLRLRPTGFRTFRNADGSLVTHRQYVADVELDGLSFQTLEVVGSQLSIALIGRDILNTLLAEFNGPTLSYSLSSP